ncbi:DNA repair protein RecO [Candidatus Protochlamydia amoebophila]|uniref:DNA repair protein RecO n=2 Tax=Candidatus Protochlamydia amoebophila TaxID=362787 RepID=A0A0C1JSU4_9BACT|nr:DNA repair protein RecO [Candidatus Protochlamydia amoebophila]
MTIMLSEFQTAEGIILKVIPFRDYDQIVAIFTKEAGLIKVLCKKSRNKKGGAKSHYTPLTKVELVYKEQKGEIFNCHEISILDFYRHLRTELNHLNAACDIIQLLYQTQLVGKPAPRLFTLTEIYLKKIPQTQFPDILTTSFRLKLLKHEGILAHPLVCSVCLQPLHQEAFFFRGEVFCRLHYPMGASYLHENEIDVLYQLLNCKNYQELTEITLFSQTKNKIERYCKETMQKE